jgi:predicted nucleotidyltransferase
MAEGPQYGELLIALNEAGVEYLIVGGYAVMQYAEAGSAEDLDVWVRKSLENSQRLCMALSRFGVPLSLAGIAPDAFSRDDLVYQVGVAPVRVDIATQIDGVTFDGAWKNKTKGTIFGVPAHFISLDDLIANKLAAGRSSDLDHLRTLRKQTGKES